VIRAGRLRHRVTIERTVETVNAVGGVTRSWTAIARRYAGIEPVSGREFVNADQTNSTVTHRIMLRADGQLTLTPKDRIVFGTRVFGIESVMDRDERGKVLEVMASEDTDP
jgi:SPP1 family predicted phage head-tail adaptor